MQPKTISMFFYKETKNTFVYQAEDEAGANVVPTLYVVKTALPKPASQRIKVTVEVVNE